MTNIDLHNNPAALTDKKDVAEDHEGAGMKPRRSKRARKKTHVCRTCGEKFKCLDERCAVGADWCGRPSCR
jgi:hypothetical protein